MATFDPQKRTISRTLRHRVSHGNLAPNVPRHAKITAHGPYQKPLSPKHLQRRAHSCRCARRRPADTLSPDAAVSLRPTGLNLDALAVCDDVILTLPQRRGLAARSRPSVPEAVIGPRGRPLSTPASGWIGTRRLRGRLCPSLSNPGFNDRGPLELHAGRAGGDLDAPLPNSSGGASRLLSVDSFKS